MQNIICYNEREVKEGQGSREDIKQGYNLWIDIENPTDSEIFNIEQSFNLDNKAVEMFLNKSKKPQIRVLGDHTFTIFLHMRYKKRIEDLDTEAIYFFLGRGWLITIHSSEVNIIQKYEQLLTAIELKILDFEKESLYRPTRKTLENLDNLSKQAIVLRRHFWQARHVMNFLIHTEEDKEDIKYLQIVYDDINQIIDLVESYRDTVNSTREIYAGSVSLQLNDTMRLLTVFSTILLPLTFITSIFGMQGFDLNNIHSIPEDFVILLAAMTIIVVVLFYMFWKRQWISAKNIIAKDKRK